MQQAFGSGILWGTPLTDLSGNAITNPSPAIFGVLQDVSVDISFDTKELYGQNQFPVTVGRGKGKIACKAKTAQVYGAFYNSLFFGGTMTNGIYSDVYETNGAIIPTTPFQITVTPPSSGTWAADLGVISATGLPMIRVASAPATGQYSAAAGVYTFAAADAALRVFINYQYTATSTTAKNSTVVNSVMGYAPTFQADLFIPYQGKALCLTLYSCISSKLSLGTKLDDFTIPELDFAAFANSAGSVMKWSTTE